MLDSELIKVATEAALKAAEIVKKGFGSRKDIISKPGKQNLVTQYDTLSEECIKSEISKQFPSHGFLAEESGRAGKGEIIWVIDPIDGTVNYAHGIPVFSISIAAVKGEQVIAGLVYQPMTGELFLAEKNQGAYLNGKKMRVSGIRNLDEALLATGFPYNVDENPLHCIDTFSEITRLGIPIRRLGSAALDLAYVAAGRFDAYWEVTLHPWDMAAGQLLVEEAGGRVSLYNGGHRDLFSQQNILASNGLLHDEMGEKLL